jgi:hypothetical protein
VLLVKSRGGIAGSPAPVDVLLASRYGFLQRENEEHHRRAATGVALTQTLDRPVERSSPDPSAWRRDGGNDLAPLWVGGAALLCLLLAFVITGPLTAVPARVDVWVPYLVLGTVFPLLVAVIVFRERAGRVLPAGWASSSPPSPSWRWPSLLACGTACWRWGWR